MAMRNVGTRNGEMNNDDDSTSYNFGKYRNTNSIYTIYACIRRYNNV